MNTISSKKKYFLPITIFSCVALLSACNTAKSGQKTNTEIKSQTTAQTDTNNTNGVNANTNTNTEPAEVNKQTKTQPVNQDKTLSESLKNENIISNGQVYIKDDMVVATMIIKAGISVQDAKNLADEYMNQLKEKYNGKKISIQAVQDGKNIVNISYGF